MEQFYVQYIHEMKPKILKSKL